MLKRVLTLCHLYACLSPWNIFDLPFYMWVAFAQSADDYLDAAKKGGA